MRAGGCTVQQSLTAEAAAVVKQAVNLARRRGHAQVTPLHVANTMLSVTTGLLRASCLQSHSHPLHCKALELCFNVALNRLPSSTSSPMLTSHYHHHHHYPPSLSNALIAAFKRAQANQRRGSMETQQQPLLAVKIELDQLIISILDDPSVSRVMREAGFSSTQVKNNVEQAVSLENSPPNTPIPSSTKTKEVSSLQTLIRARSEDVRTVIDSLLIRPRKRSIVVVGETSAAAEAVVRGVIDRQEMDEGLRDLKFITLPVYSFSTMSKEEVDQKVGELRCLLVKRRGIVLYLGDLKWVAEYRLSLGRRSGYCPVEHVVMEIRSMLCGGGGIDERFWVMGIGTYHTVTRCRVGSPSLEAVWGLQLIDVPAGSLELSLKCDSDPQSPLNSKKNRDWSSWSLQESVVNQLSCCADCSLKFEIEAHGLPNFFSSGNGSISSNLPSWLQQYKRECKNEVTKDHVWIQNLCKKWNSICHSSHKYHPSEMTLHFSSTSPSSSISSHNHHHSIFHLETDQSPLHDLWLNSNPIPNPNSNSASYGIPNPNPNSNSASSSDTMEMGHCPNKFKELNAENLKTLCTALEREVPWQSDIVPNIASTVLRCRSGMVRNKERTQPKEDTWLFFLGGDQTGKETITREIARLVFGSRASLVSIGFTRFSPTLSGLTDEEQCNKRLRSENRHGYRFLEKFAEEISENPHRVILIEDVGQMDSYTHMGIRNAIQRGRIQRLTGEEIDVCDAIVVFCCERFDSRSKLCSPRLKQKFEIEELNGEDGICLDLNLSVGDDCSLDDVGLTEFVDLAVLFKFPDL